MKTKKGDKLSVTAFVSLAVAVLSMFTTVIGYTNSAGVTRTFSIIDFFSSNGNSFDSFVSREYIGKVYRSIYIDTIRIYAVVAIIAIICAFYGVIIISKQKENTGAFILALIGLIGTMGPSVLMLICLVALRNNYMGTITCGIYPIVSPIAMIICIIATTKMHRKNMEYRNRMKEAEGYIFRGGDL